jgi:hypothetical protein
MVTRLQICAVSMTVAFMVALSGCGSSSNGNNHLSPSPSFTLMATPATASIGQGGSAASTITVVPHNGFIDPVTFTLSGLPDGVTASFNPAMSTTTTVLTLIASDSAATGNASVTVTGSADSLAPTTPIALTVAAPSATVTLAPTHAELAASTQTQQFTPTVTGNLGNTNVNWSVDNIAGGNATVGTITNAGFYTPPSTGGAHTVTATSAALATASATANVAVTDLAGVFTYHNDLARDGANTQEYALTSANVKTANFGKLFSCGVDGAVYTQPLWVPGVSIGGGTHNIVIVATQHDSLYAFDADASPCVMYWQVNLIDTLHGGTSGEVPVPWKIGSVYQVGYGYGDIQPEVGVTGTPVIDPASGTIYVVSKSEITSSTTFFQRLHALDLTTGSEQTQFNSPVAISASVPGTGDGGATVHFSPRMQHQRSGLALANGTVYLDWAAHEDATPYHGWLMGYNAANLAMPQSVFNTTPNGGLGGIWGGGGAPAIENTGDIYVSTGNGIFDANNSSVTDIDYGDSLLRLHPGSGLSLVDWFTPDNQQQLADEDADLGSGAIVLMPDQTVGPTHVLVEVGKGGVAYLVNRDGMGNYQANNNSQIRQSFNVGPGMWGTPALWNNGLYFAQQNDSLKLFSFDPSTGFFNTAVSSQSTATFGYPGASPSVSSSGTSNGIVWIIDAGQYGPPAPGPGPAILHAYNAAHLATEYWNSTLAASNRDQAGNAVKFAPPTIANGKVYISTRSEVDVYGLLP